MMFMAWALHGISVVRLSDEGEVVPVCFTFIEHRQWQRS